MIRLLWSGTDRYYLLYDYSFSFLCYLYLEAYLHYVLCSLGSQLSLNRNIQNLMIEWKHLQLSSEDYENFINNEDQEVMKINDLNITEWQQLYHSVQMMSLENKQIKRHILSYENNLKRITADSELKMQKKEAQRQYYELNNEFKIRLSQLYSQLDLLHLSNVSTTVEFVISRLLCIEEDLIITLTSNEHKIHQLQMQLDQVQIAQKLNICNECSQHIQKTKYKYLKNQILAGEDPNLDTSEGDLRTEEQNIKKYMREEMHNEQNQYEVKRMHYLYDLEEALRNKEKTMQYSNTPLHAMLEDYLHHTLQILEAKKINFAPKNIGEFGRVNQSYEVLQEMKKLFNHKQFRQNISQMLEKPFSDFEHKLKRAIQKTLHPKEGFMCDAEAQTKYIKEYQTIAHLEKQISRMSIQLEGVKTSKNKMENDMETFRKHELRNMELANKNKQLQGETSRLESECQTMKKKIEELQENQKMERNNLIQTNLLEKSTILQDMRKVEGELKRIKSDKFQTLRVERVEKEIQTDPFTFQSAKSKILNEESENRKSHKKAMLKTQKTHKRISIQVEQKSNAKMNDLIKLAVEEASKRDSLVNNKKVVEFQRNSKDSQAVFTRDAYPKRSRVKPEKEPQVLKINNINPSRQLFEDVALLPQEMSPATSQFRTESSVLIGEAQNTRRIHKLADVKRGHFYHKSDFIYPSNKLPSPSVSQVCIPQKTVTPNASMKHVATEKMKSTLDLLFDQSKKDKSIIISSKDYILINSQDCKIEDQLEGSREKVQLNTFNEQLRETGKENKQSSSGSRLKKLFKGSNYHNLNKKQITFLEKFIQFCIIHYKSLYKLNAFQLVYNLEQKQQQQSPQQPTQESPNLKLQIQHEDRYITPQKQLLHLYHPTSIKVCLQLFTSLEEAKKYENRLGFWGELDHCIMVDNYYGSQCDKIEVFFSELRLKRPEFYYEYCSFLMRPSKMLKVHDSKEKMVKTITEESCEQKQEYCSTQIKKTFKKLFSFHKLLHRKCNHVHNFLGLLGFHLD